MLHPAGDIFLFSMVPQAQMRASPQTPISCWMSKGLEPSRIVISNVWIFLFPALAYLSFFLGNAPSQSNPLHLWPAMLGNPSSHCAEIQPLNFRPRTHIPPSGTQRNTEQSLPRLLFILQFQVYRGNSTINTHMLFIYSPIINIFPYLRLYLLLFFPSGIIWGLFSKHKTASPRGAWVAQ